MSFIKIYGKKVISVFKFLNLKEQLREEIRKNEALEASMKDLENATLELAEIVSMNEQAIMEVKDGQNIL